MRFLVVLQLRETTEVKSEDGTSMTAVVSLFGNSQLTALPGPLSNPLLAAY